MRILEPKFKTNSTPTFFIKFNKLVTKRILINLWSFLNLKNQEWAFFAQNHLKTYRLT